MLVPSAVVGVILAGGRSRRMGGGDKALLSLRGLPMLTYIVERLRGQVGTLVLNANGDPTRFRDFGLPVVADSIDGCIGPLGGILTGLEWAREKTDCAWIVTVASDTPFLPKDLVARLGGSLDGEQIVVARSRNRPHPTIALWSVTQAEELSEWLLEPGRRAIRSWIETRPSKAIDFESDDWPDPFFNVNTPDDLATAERYLQERA